MSANNHLCSHLWRGNQTECSRLPVWATCSPRGLQRPRGPRCLPHPASCLVFWLQGMVTPPRTHAFALCMAHCGESKKIKTCLRWCKLVEFVRRQSVIDSMGALLLSLPSGEHPRVGTTLHAKVMLSNSVSHSAVSDSLRLHGLYSQVSLVHEIPQGSILEWVAPVPQGSSLPRDHTQVS